MDNNIQFYTDGFADPARRLGLSYVPGQGGHARLWAPKAAQVEIEWQDGTRVPLQKSTDGYFSGFFDRVRPGDTYRFVLDGNIVIADPAARLVQDTTGPAVVAGQDFAWTDTEWRGVPFGEWIIYELHAGTFSGTHDFAGIIADLPRLKELGITTIELMPVSQFSGARNWGYDGVFPHAVQDSYGGPDALKQLVDACHAQGLAIILDVVFNHLGPEGNILFRCAPYATETYRTPWGEALNFDGEYCTEVRRYFLQAAWQWLTEYHFDGLRLDAVQMIFDRSPVPFMQELYFLKQKAEELRGYPLVLIGESDMNDARILQSPTQNGFGLDAQWADDFHNALHATLTGERDGYYADFGGLAQLAKIYRRGVAYENEYSAFHKRFHGRSYEHIDKRQLVIQSQNHDQIGNRLKGERLISLVGFEKAKLAAACVLLSPFTPLLFMGEEFACDQPFNYFVSHHSDELLTATKKSRAEEWASFGWDEEPVPPESPEIFEQSVLRDKRPAAGTPGADMFAWYKQLTALSPRLRACGQPDVGLDEGTSHVTLRYGGQYLVLLSFADRDTAFQPPEQAQRLLGTGTATTIPPFSAHVWSLAS